jgi:hypothetical protein
MPVLAAIEMNKGMDVWPHQYDSGIRYINKVDHVDLD